MKNTNRTGYDLTSNRPMSYSLMAAEGPASDRMGSLAGMKQWFALCLEPGIPYVPFAGMTSDEVADAFAEEAIVQEEQRQRQRTGSRHE